MTEPTPIYSGEAVLLNWHDAKSGRKIVLQLEKYAPGAHPFDGLDGERFAVVIVGPLAPAEHEPVARKGKAGGAPTREDGGAPRGVAVQPPATKPKRHWRDMPPSQRAGILAKDPEFREWLRVTADLIAEIDEDYAIAEVRSRCGVESRSMITPGSNAEMQFNAMEGRFQAWRQAKGHGQI